MINFESLGLFEEYVDQQSGVKSYILKEKPASCVQSFYFINQSLSSDNRYLWMYCFYPPLCHHSLGVVSLDPQAPFVRAFPEAIFWDFSPVVAPEGDKVYFSDLDLKNGRICSIDINGHIEEFAVMDPNYVENRILVNFGTHLTISSDRKYMLVDGSFATHDFVATIDMESRKFNIIMENDAHYNHAQFSPVHPNLFLYDQDWRYNPITGRRATFRNRIWLCDTEATQFEPIVQRSWHGHDGTMFCHDFWSQDGKICWQDYAKGAYEMDVVTREMVHVWKEPLCHSHCNADRSLWVADQSPYAWPKEKCRVIFFNRATEKTIDIFSAMPAPVYTRSAYHLDPHPQFTKDGKYIICTTTVLGGIDLAITPVDQLVSLTY